MWNCTRVESFQALVGIIAVLVSVSWNAGASVAAPLGSNGCSNSNALGVSRVIEIDTSEGPKFGNLQYGVDGQQVLKEGEVVLTFDDGPLTRNTELVLAALKAQCTRATFFAVGRMAVVYPHTLRKVADAGHTIAHHTWSHEDQARRSFARAIAEFELGVSSVTAAIGRPSAPFFRFPYLSDPGRMRAYIAQRGFGLFSIDIDSYDFRTRSGETMRRNTMSQLKKRGRGIILFHDIQTSTARGIANVLADIKRNGFRIVHIVAKAPARTLPEYDAEAQILLEKRRFGARARPIKTSFKFNGSQVPVETLPQRSAPSRNGRDGQRPRQSVRAGAGETRPRRASQRQRKAAPDPKPTPVAVPQWKRRIFEIGND